MFGPLPFGKHFAILFIHFLLAFLGANIGKNLRSRACALGNRHCFHIKQNQFVSQQIHPMLGIGVGDDDNFPSRSEHLPALPHSPENAADEVVFAEEAVNCSLVKDKVEVILLINTLHVPDVGADVGEIGLPSLALPQLFNNFLGEVEAGDLDGARPGLHLSH